MYIYIYLYLYLVIPSPCSQASCLFPISFSLFPTSQSSTSQSIIMVILNACSNTPHHRQNRRRERPGSRTRRSAARKSVIQSNLRHDCDQGILDARDSSLPLPSDRAKPSPLLRQNFDQSWQRWKARQAEEKALADMDTMRLQQELLLFGGDVDDDVSLCEPMLRVVMNLFGDIDYTDP